MSQKIRWFAMFMVLALALSACAGNATVEKAQDEMMDEMPEATEAMMDEMPEATEAMMDEMPEATETMMDHMPEATEAVMDEMPEATEAMMDEMSQGEDAMMETPAYFKAMLTDAATGASFSIQDFEDRVVLVETMAMWCPKCLQQQRQVMALLEGMGERDDFVMLGLDVDPNEVLTDLTNYVETNGFDWYYAVAPADVAREIGELYSDQFLNPSATPMFIIDRHGKVHPLPFGIKSADELGQALEPFLSE